MTSKEEEHAERKKRKAEENRENTKQHIVEAREKHKESLNVVYTALSEINRRVFTLQDLIKEAQHKQHGSVTLSLNSCGKSCSGCPHPVWLKWVNTARNKRFSTRADTAGLKSAKTGKFVAVKVQNPKAIVAQSRAVKDHTAAMLVAEAVDLLDRRALIIKHLSQALRTSKKAIENI